MIDFYTYGTVNGKAVAIALEAMGVEYQTHVIDLSKFQQRGEEFLKINPSGRIPVIVDHAYQKPLVVTQTGAILVYLAEQTGLFMGNNAQQKAQIMSWLWFQITDITTNFFNNFYLKSLVDPKQPAAGDMLKKRAQGFYQEFNQQLAEHPFLTGNDMSIADMAAYPVVSALKDQLLNSQHAHLNRWYQDMSQNTAVILGMKGTQ